MDWLLKLLLASAPEVVAAIRRGLESEPDQSTRKRIERILPPRPGQARQLQKE